ncbi:hypothetical protein TNCV_3025541 [Trichonephila clavipes]|nr:hypothetical protein TNCV_3025541 [Trichonephila clavipes]
MLLRCHRRRYEQQSEFERERIIEMMEAGWSARRGRLGSAQIGRSDLTGLVGCCPDTSSTFTTGPCASPNHRKATGSKICGIVAPIICAANDTYQSTPPFGVVSLTTGLNCNGMEPGHLQ